MSYSAICPAISTQLGELAGPHAPQNKVSQNGFVHALLSPYNYNALGVRLLGEQNQVIPLMSPDGRVSRIQIMNQQRSTRSEMDNTVLDCYLDGEASKDDNFATTIDPFGDGELMEVETPLKEIEDKEVRELCEGKESWFTKRLSLEMDGLASKMNYDLLTKASTLFGNYANGDNSGTDPIYLDLVQTVDGQRAANKVGEADFLDTLSDARTTGMPMVIGNGLLRTYQRLIQIGCCNRMGIDLSSPAAWAWFEDGDVADVIGDANAMIALEAGAFGIVPMPQNVGSYAMTEASFQKGVIHNPTLDLWFDFRMEYDKSCDKWKYRISLKYYPLALYNGNNMYKSADPLKDINGIFLFNSAS